MKNEKFCSQLSTYSNKEQEDFQTLRAAGETETTQENIQDWLQLDEADLGFQFLTEERIAVDVIKDSAMEEGSDSELGEVQEYIIFIF
jgi:hypothetical protein